MVKKINFEGKEIFYRVYGKGRPVIFVHGFGENGDVWRNQVEYLKHKFQIIVPDLPGSGQSQLISDMSMEGMAGVIKLIADFECVKDDTGSSKSSTGQLGKSERFSTSAPFSLIGHSMGGYITLSFAEKYESQLLSFGLFHSSAFADSEEKKATRLKGIEFMNEHGAFDFLKTAIPNLFSPEFKSQFPDILEELIDQGHNFSTEALVSYYESMISRPDRTHVLKKASIPVLFVMGKYDTAIPLEDGLKQCHLPEKSYIHVLQESGHMGMLEEADKSNRLLEEFLSTS